MAGDAVRIGVVALQGAFREHREVLARLGAETVEVRRPEDLNGLDGLVIPGGESTTIRLLMTEFGLEPDLRDAIARGLPVLGTCAGMIVLAKRVDGEPIPGLEGLDVSVRRNAFGRQVDSFEQDLVFPAVGDQPVHAVFIRAPVVESVGEGVEVLARIEDGRIVAVKQGAVLGIAFHPELTPDTRIHRYFLDLVARLKSNREQQESHEAEPTGVGGRSRGVEAAPNAHRSPAI
ncbi:MAG TPA: pyridoxal 5'-phosphate synthase glutaminase subunit PdxT [Chloroflexota bacterium]|nr:pyridoxal 5'-phosphate synthase glutaminase subunit PdxT [Chloroflexota bacterium]